MLCRISGGKGRAGNRGVDRAGNVDDLLETVLLTVTSGEFYEILSCHDRLALRLAALLHIWQTIAEWSQPANDHWFALVMAVTITLPDLLSF